MSTYTLTRVIETQLIDVAQKTRALREATARLEELRALVLEEEAAELRAAESDAILPTDSPTRHLSLAPRSPRQFADS